jgi:parvulin-like peptidyl-prolyl isomerase
MRYLLRRAVMSGAPPSQMLQAIVNELIVMEVVPKPPYNVTVTESDVDQFLRGMAQGDNESISDGEFREWLRQQLNTTRLKEAEFRALARVTLLTLRLTTFLGQQIPTVAEQVHLFMIPARDVEAAFAVKNRLDAGESFAALAKETSTAAHPAQPGGELGWFPRLGLPSDIERVVFDELAVGEVSGPVAVADQGFAIFKVAERVAARKVDEGLLQTMQARALDDWYLAESQKHRVRFFGLKGGGYDSVTDAWARWQVEQTKSGTRSSR